MPNPAYVANYPDSAKVGITTTPATILKLAASANNVITLRRLIAALDASVTVVLELCESTEATAGTAGTAPTVKQVRGFTAGTDGTPSTTCTGKYSVEPTVLTPIYTWNISGLLDTSWPLGQELQSLLSGSTKFKSLCLRAHTITGTVNLTPTLEFEE